MNKISSLALLTLAIAFSNSALASKARVASLLGADHLIDSQTAFTNPAYLTQLGQYITLEMGAPGTAAEGGFTKKTASGDKLSMYLGHKNVIANFANNDVRLANNFIGQNNPLEVLYSMGSMGFGGSLSTLDDKKNGVKETTVIGKFGVSENKMAYYVHAHLVSTAEKTTAGNTDKISAPGLVAGGSMDVETMRYFGSLHVGNAKLDIAAPVSSTTIKDTNLSVGFEDRSMKTAENDIYYGAKIDVVQRDVAGAKISGTQLPVFMGLEYTVNSWAVFRGSVAQNLLVGSIKDETGANKDAAGIASNTTVAAGLGFKYNSLVLDGSLTAASNGAINGNAFLANAAVTYNF